ncbi:MAG: hypothetical protein ACI841_000468 [Planctomycetota bacterium]|jgi:hypothetical protein
MLSVSAAGISLVALSLAALAQNPTALGQHGSKGYQSHCNYIGARHAMSFTPGAMIENFLVTTGDPDSRRFIVQVPSSYQANRGPYPVVYMLHGTGQSAGDMANNLSWDELGEAMSFIVVFPEALEYDLQDGTRRTKWATDNVANNVVEPYELPMADDVLFIRELHNTLGAHLEIDCERVYASGFSNGGGFVKSKIRVHLADVFAATSNAGGLGIQVSTPGEFFPSNGFDFRPHFEILGDKDSNKKEACVLAGDLLPGENLPIAAADIIATPCMWTPLTALAEEMGMDPASFLVVEQGTRTMFQWHLETLPSPHTREYRFVILHNLTHEYPSGTNYPIDYAPIYYDWMMQYTR